VIADITRGQWGAHNRETVIKQTAQADAMLGLVDTWVEQEPGSGGKESAEGTVLNLAGHAAYRDRVTGDKVTRSKNLRAQVEAQNVDLVAGEWNEPFLKEAHVFDGVHGFTDQVDAASGAFNKLTLGAPIITPIPLQGV
jgi:predicted phage terminase large subunit-like protein